MSVTAVFIAAAALVLLAPSVTAQKSWTASTMPNPTRQIKECNMKTRSSLCDPDAVLTEQQRYRINHELNQLEARTAQDFAATFCDKKGITPILVIARHIGDGSEVAIKSMSNQLRQQWSLDHQCQKAVVIAIATDDRKFWVSRDDKVPVYASEFSELFNNQKGHFKDGNFEQGILNVLQGTWEKALSKQAAGVPSDDGGFGGNSGGSGPGFGGNSGGGKNPLENFSLPAISPKLIILLLLVVVPLLFCCCCIYCCCCRGKGGDTNRRGPNDVEGGDGFQGDGRGGQAAGGGGGFGQTARSFFGSAAGTAVMNGIMNCVRNRNAGGGGGGGGGGYGGGAGGGGGSYPMSPTRHGQNPTGKGAYPAAVVKDEGGGGGW